MTTATRKTAARKAGKKPAARPSKIKRVYFFGAGKAEGRADQKPLLGGKGANLHDMTSIGLPVPPGFTITTEACAEYYKDGGKLPPGLMDEVEANLHRLEKVTGKEFGNPGNPLLVSVRSGAAVSMPGMMDTVLNLGLNDAVTDGLAKLTKNLRFAYDSYRRLINMFGDVVMGIDHAEFEHELTTVKNVRGVQNDTDLTADDLKEVVQR
ncbi:MAG: PEP/pyruvate-binding domain-containing protein, partial [Bacillota bacterium]